MKTRLLFLMFIVFAVLIIGCTSSAPSDKPAGQSQNTTPGVEPQNTAQKSQSATVPTSKVGSRYLNESEILDLKMDLLDAAITCFGNPLDSYTKLDYDWQCSEKKEYQVFSKFGGCARLSPTSDLDTREKCDTTYAVVEKDETFCEKQETFRSSTEGCFREVAFAKNDVALCEKADTFKGICISDIAFLNRNESICNQINETYYQESCLAKIITKNAALAMDVSVCLKNQDKLKTGDVPPFLDCVTSVSITTKNESNCDYLIGYPDAPTGFDFCMSTVAEETQNEALCEKAKTYRDLCYSIIATETKNVLLCEKISDEKGKQYCKEDFS